ELSDLDALCSRLITMANERGGPDNITVVAVRFEGEGLPEAGADEAGYHAFPSGNADSGEIPALGITHEYREVIPRLPPPPPPPPPPPDEVVAPEPEPAAPMRRSGSPATIAAVGGGIL